MATGKFNPTEVVGPNGEKWAGRGRQPKWLKELLATDPKWLETVRAAQAASAPQASAQSK